jgi:hypothetical protein
MGVTVVMAPVVMEPQELGGLAVKLMVQSYTFTTPQLLIAHSTEMKELVAPEELAVVEVLP